MSNSKSNSPVVALKLEIRRLNLQLTYWKGRVAELESALAIKLPVMLVQFAGKDVRIALFDGVPVVLVDDVTPHIPGVERHKVSQRQREGQRMRNAGLGVREMRTVNAEHLAHAWNTSYRHLCAALGKSTKARQFSFVTPLGIETLRDRAPKFCKWVEAEAFPNAIEQLGKGGAE